MVSSVIRSARLEANPAILPHILDEVRPSDNGALAQSACTRATLYGACAKAYVATEVAHGGHGARAGAQGIYQMPTSAANCPYQRLVQKRGLETAERHPLGVSSSAWPAPPRRKEGEHQQAVDAQRFHLLSPDLSPRQERRARK
jgi:hypothetical protein